jgi:hypothetical protein
VSLLQIAHAHLVIMTICQSAAVNRTDWFRSALAAASGFDIKHRSAVTLEAQDMAGLLDRRPRGVSSLPPGLGDSTAGRRPGVKWADRLRLGP